MTIEREYHACISAAERCSTFEQGLYVPDVVYEVGQQDRIERLAQIAKLRIPLIADTHSKLIADSVPGDHGHAGWGA
jgi:hypothetical protein